MQHDPHSHEAAVAEQAVRIPDGSLWHRLPMIGGILGVAALGVAFVLGQGNTAQLYHSYLVAFLFGLSLALGGLFFVLIQYATRAGWSVVVRRLAENVMGTLPVFAVLFVPIAFLGFEDLFHHWTHPDPSDEILAQKEPYLNATFFYVRAVFYFVVWTAMAIYFGRASKRQDEVGGPSITGRLQSLSAPGLILFGVTVTYAAFDWIMSLDPHWFSTMFGVYFFAGCVIAIFAVLVLLVLRLQAGGLLDGVVTWEHFHDLGKLLFAFTVFWAYIAFSQFMLIWYANIPEETAWYVHRWHHGWEYVSVFLAAGHFGVPFLFLLPQEVKRSRPALTFAALWLLVVHYVDLFWLIMPSLHHEALHVDLLDILCLVGVLGVFVGALAWQMTRSNLIPTRDPRLAESLAFENV